MKSIQVLAALFLCALLQPAWAGPVFALGPHQLIARMNGIFQQLHDTSPSSYLMAYHDTMDRVYPGGLRSSSVSGGPDDVKIFCITTDAKNGKNISQIDVTVGSALSKININVVSALISDAVLVRALDPGTSGKQASAIAQALLQKTVEEAKKDEPPEASLVWHGIEYGAEFSQKGKNTLVSFLAKPTNTYKP